MRVGIEQIKVFIKQLVKKYFGSNIWVNIYFWKEFLLINSRFNLKRYFKGDPSIFFFTTHKCASTFTPEIMSHIASERRLIQLDYARYLWHKKNSDVYAFLTENKDSLFSPNGFVYAPLRRFVECACLPNAKVIIMLRDPRDVLVSMYYSMAYTHELPGNHERRDSFLVDRSRIINMSIDDFVLERSLHFQQVYSEYFNALEANHGYFFCTYEKMIFDFSGWVSEIESYVGARVDLRVKARWKTLVTPQQGERLLHKRKITPGDYRDKLKPETVIELNKIFDRFLSHFDDAPHGTR